MLYQMGRQALACAAFFLAAGSVTAAEDTEILIRKAMAFEHCPAAIKGILAQMSADESRVHLTHDTAAQYRVKLQSVSANLIFNCNAVAEQIEISRQVPGDLVVATN